MSTSGTALITGASSGIGATYAKRLAARGYDLILVARDESRLNQLAALLSEQHTVQVKVLAADLTDEQDVQRVESELATNANITLLLNNAGMSVEGEFLEADINRINSMLTLNIVTPTRLAQAAGRAFKARGNGIIINIASVLALVHEMFNGAYNATKSYVLTLTRAMQRELADSGVHVQAVLPGATRTEIFDRAGQPINTIPAERLMEVDEMVDAALAGLDNKEAVTIPPLEDLQMWQDYDRARGTMVPHLSRNKSATRYHQS